VEIKMLLSGIESLSTRELLDNVTDADWTPDGSDLALARSANDKFRLSKNLPLTFLRTLVGGKFPTCLRT
jgi:hypothetical protein